MSLSIDVEKVESILLADGWHDIAPGSFDIDAYEFNFGELLIHFSNQPSLCVTGFTAHIGDIDHGVKLYGPMTALLAVADSPMEHAYPPVVAAE